MKPAKKSKCFLLLVFIALSLAGCGKKNIDHDTLVKTYVQNVIAEETYSYNPDSLRIHRQKIFDKNKISEKDFEEIMKSYRKDPKEWENFFKQSSAMLDSLRKNNIIN